MRESPATNSAPQNGRMRPLYEHWLDSWETALAALATAAQSRTLSTKEAAAHHGVIAVERKLVTKEFTLLIGADVDGLPRRSRTEIRV